MRHSGVTAIALVALGGAADSAGRAGVALAMPGAPLAATLLVNVVGAFLLGALIAVLDSPASGSGSSIRGGVRAIRARLLLGTGFCGGFTTYSLVALQTAELVRGSDLLAAAGYALVTLVTGALATLLGLTLAGRAGGAR